MSAMGYLDGGVTAGMRTGHERRGAVNDARKVFPGCSQIGKQAPLLLLVYPLEGLHHSSDASLSASSDDGE